MNKHHEKSYSPSNINYYKNKNLLKLPQISSPHKINKSNTEDQTIDDDIDDSIDKIYNNIKDLDISMIKNKEYK